MPCCGLGPVAAQEKDGNPKVVIDGAIAGLQACKLHRRGLDGAIKTKFPSRLGLHRLAATLLTTTTDRQSNDYYDPSYFE